MPEELEKGRSKVLDDVKESIVDDFTSDDSEQTFFIEIEFRKLPEEGKKEIGRMTMPPASKDSVRSYLLRAIDILRDTLLETLQKGKT